MNWNTLWHDWKFIAVAAAMCLGAFLLYQGAWNIGYQANALGLLGWHFLRFVLLLFAWAVLVSGFRAALTIEKPAAKPGLKVWEGVSVLPIFLGCMGCYPMWPAVLLLMAPVYMALIFSKSGPTGERLSRSELLRAGVVVLLFLLTWYFCASTTRQAMRGLGDRIEAKCGADKLTAWAAEVVAAHQRRQQALPIVAASTVALAASPQGHGTFAPISVLLATRTTNQSWYLEPYEIPDWVDDLLGTFQGVRSVMVEGSGDGLCVALRTGGSAFHFRISVCPSSNLRPSPLWWFGERSELEQHGIHLETEGK
jgi:hypothetical protein